MNTPIFDFVEKYKKSNTLRMHMPGHKGKCFLGMESGDITEISGADSLYEADGIILESEKNAGFLFGADTFYSTEGSSLCIRAMLFLALTDAKENGRNPVILAGRNAHKTFINSAALLDFDIKWLYSNDNLSYLSCVVDCNYLEKLLLEENPAAVYITSPDYLGNLSDVAEISKLCHKHNTLLIVDNAHGAYLKFLKNSKHPVDLGADICCDSAHKTLPVLTGGAYLHISNSAPECFKNRAKNALALFGSTSPSYLILQSLDLANKYLSEKYSDKLEDFALKIKNMKKRLEDRGYNFVGDEPIKITIDAKLYGYTGKEFATELSKRNIEVEFCDFDYTVLMLTPEIADVELGALEKAMSDILKREPILIKSPKIPVPSKVMSVREAAFSLKEELPVDKSLGRVLASATISCPPAVPIVVCGEKIDEDCIACLKYYGIEKCLVVK